MAEDARKWAVEGLCDARSLPEALTERRFPLLLHHLEKLEQHRNWLLDTAEYVLREDEQMRLSERDAHWLEEVIRQKNRDEGDIRFCAIDLSWRRLCIETCILAGDLEDARIALKAYFTSDTSDRRKIYNLQPDGLQHLLVFANAYDAYIAKAAAAQEKGKRAPRWPFKGLPNDGKIDAELLVKMSKDWALCVWRQLRRMKKLPYLMRPEVQQFVPASTSQSHSQDSLPTPGPSSDAFGAASTSARQAEDRGSPRKRRRTESSDGKETRLQEGEEAVEVMHVEVVVEAEETAVEMDDATDVGIEADQTPEPPAIAVDAGSSPVRATPPPVVSAEQHPPPVSPRRSPRLSPSLQPTPERRAASPAPSPRRSPRPRARSPTSLTAPSAFLAPPSPNDDAESLPESQLPPEKPFPTDIFSLLAKGAAEQDQKLRSSRRMSEPAPPAEPTPPPEQTAPSEPQPAVAEEEADAPPAREPVQPSHPAPPPATPLGPSASTILMPPPPATTKSKGSTQSPAPNVSTTAPALASSQDSVEPSSAEPSTLPSDISAVADLSGESQNQSQSQPHATDDPPPGQPATERSGNVPPLAGFTASTSASPADVSMDAPTPAQGAKQLVPDTPESSAPPAKAVVAETVEAAVSVTLVSQSTQSTSSGSGTSNHVSDSQSLAGEPSGSKSVAIVSSLETASSSQPNPFTQPILPTRPFTRGTSVQPIVNVLATPAQTAATGTGSISSQQSSFGSDTSGLTYLSHTEMERIQEEALAAQRAKDAEAEKRRKRAEREAAEEARRQAEREMLELQQDEASQGILGTDEDDDMSATASPANVSVERVEADVDRMDVDEMDDEMPLSQAPVTQAFPSTQADLGDGTTPEDGSPVKGRPRRRSFIEVESEAENNDAPDVDDEAGGFLEFVNLDGNE
ncbi:hypothetical protein OF846_000187 [Rhodotorula toruloides]|nr:hypothetical protein OF846_000187 [Rhodotorula toruloides]